jgi:uncharacterized protein (TIGR03382 family)
VAESPFTRPLRTCLGAKDIFEVLSLEPRLSLEKLHAPQAEMHAQFADLDYVDFYNQPSVIARTERESARSKHAEADGSTNLFVLTVAEPGSGSLSLVGVIGFALLIRRRRSVGDVRSTILRN